MELLRASCLFRHWTAGNGIGAEGVHAVCGRSEKTVDTFLTGKQPGAVLRGRYRPQKQTFRIRRGDLPQKTVRPSAPVSKLPVSPTPKQPAAMQPAVNERFAERTRFELVVPLRSTAV